MAQIKRIVRDSPISNFQQGAPEGGGAFRLLAEGLNELYDRVAPVAVDKMTQRGEVLGREAAKAQFGDDRPFRVQPTGGGGTDSLSGGSGGDNLGGGGILETIRGHEGFRTGTYWDVNAYRLGYGSDTITAPDGTVRKVKKGDTVTREDAERDLVRRVNTEFLPQARRDVGEDTFNNLTEGQQAVLGSIAYNYGNVPKRIRGAIQSGDPATAAAAIRSLGSDNNGINRGRRAREAEAFIASGGQDVFAGGGADNLAGGLSVSPGGTEDTIQDAPDAPAPAYEPPTMVRTSSGALESRLYSPYSSPILQARNAAAKIAYQSEVLNKSAVDLMDMSQQFPLDPDGYQKAAEEYVDTMVDSAPTDYQMELRSTLAKEVQRRSFGMMEEVYRDVRQRANNSSAALVERWSGNLTDAILTGDPGLIAEAQNELDNLLQAREALPGVAWTPAQSGNVILKAREAAEVQAARRRKEASDDNKDTLNLIIKGAKVGASVAGEGILNDPAVIADHPELAREAAATVALRDNMPEILSMTPAQQAAAAAALAAEDVVEEWQLDIAKAAGDIAKASKKAWDDDPVQQAATVLTNDPPPPMPELTPEDPAKMIQGLAARREYMNRIRAQGYTDTPAFLSESEAEGLQAAMGPDTPPELRAAMAGAIVGGFGPDAVSVFGEIDGDRVTMFAGKMMALGGNQALASTILKGQQMIDEGLVRVPPQADRIDKFSDTAADAFVGTIGGVEAQVELMAAAQAIYAADPTARGLEPTSEAAKKLMETSIQTALGQAKNKRGQTTGGVQEIMGNSTLLPIGVSGDRVNEVLEQAFGEGPEAFIQRFMRGPGSVADVPDAGLWGESPPLFNGKPIPKAYVRDGGIRIVPYRGNTYRMEIITGSGAKPAEDANGNVYFFDLQELMEAAE